MRTAFSTLVSFLFAVTILLLGGCQKGEHSRAGTASADGGYSHSGHAHGDDEMDLSSQARVSLGLTIEPLKKTSYARMLRVPGQIVPIPGVTQIDVTAKASGEVTKIFALEGQLIEPGQPLVELQLTHEEAITAQIELLDALAKLEVVYAELERLESLEMMSPGSVAGTRLVQQRNERGHLLHTIASRRQMLNLLGLPADKVDALIERHRRQHHDMLGDAPDHEETLPLLERLTIYAPQRKPAASEQTAPFAVERLHARIGQHVEVGTALALLGDYRQLYAEATAFEQDLGIVRRAMTQGWEVTAAVELREAEEASQEDLQVLYIAPSVDVDSRSARFYVALENDLQMATRPERRRFADWRFRPGQRIEVRVPIEQFHDEFVLPVEAVIREGLDYYLFVVDGPHVMRRKIGVRYRDEEVTVLDESARSLEGKRIVMSGAYQLKLAFLNRSSGPVAHGHTH